MRIRSVRKSLSIVCYLATSLCSGQVFADWSGDKLYKGYNQQYGDFPPADIDQQLSGIPDTNKVPESSPSQADNAATLPNNTQPVPGQAQNYQQPAYGGYNQGRNYYQPRNQRRSRNTSSSGPWNNNRSGFSGPWNNRGSGFSGPWDNNRSGFSGPWNNNGSSFSGPWDNNGSNFSMPWGNNNNSGFSPWGNGGGFSW